ncbi:sulfatase [Reichenbachiella carrageenanivorans]|uniref:Sulfatase n=1 Tax=Reichenbachiella carrageenanivorans TaxID=2979869 RepID=A0ABY6D4F7_9BACT|nr:sulfatase [Reichenbachiella carrageenanivorans]UXX81026.1 sulfatase [Reichenbachiella carrageenanivorans]
MNKISLLYSLLTFLSFYGEHTLEQPTNRPNIIFIITDDQQTGLLGIEGAKEANTPHIDRIGQEGVLFKNAFVVTPLCSPSRASFLTGNYSHKHNVINNDKLGLDVVSHTLLTWPRQLRESGYETAFIGKWHMGLDDSRRPGFDRWFSFKGQGDYIDGVVNDEDVHLQTTGYMTDIINERALDYLTKDHGNKPFAMVIAHKAIHWPLLPATRHESLYTDFEFDSLEIKKSDIDGKPMLTRSVDRQAFYAYENVLPEPPESRRGRGRKRSVVVADQLRCLASVNEGIGEIFSALEKSNQLDNTIIIYTSDNGMLMGQHGEFNIKRWAYDPVIRIPMLIRYPKLIPKGSIKEEMILNIDLAPTLLELAQIEPLEPMNGQSMVPLFEQSNAPWRSAFLTEYFLEKVAPRVRPWQAVRTEDWKYIHYTEAEMPSELYHLANDPSEEHNLIDQPSAQDQLKVMQQKLAQLLQESE